MKYFILVFLWLQSAWCFAGPNHWFEFDKQHEVNLTVDLYLSSICPHCHKADDFFSEQEKKLPWLKVHRHLINQDKQALRIFYDQLKAEGDETNFFVPAIFFCQSHWTGFNTARDSGEILLKNILYCREKIQQEGTLTQATKQVLKEKGKASELFAKSGELPDRSSFIILAGLTDAFAACNFFCFTAFISCLWLLPWRLKMQWMGGGLLVLVIGLIHYLQESQVDLYSMPMAGLPFYTFIIGAILLVWVTLLVTKSPILTTFVGVLSLCAIYYCQQTCLLNVAYVFEHWLVEQSYSSPIRALCVFIYQLCYVLPLLIWVVVWSFLSERAWVIRRKSAMVFFARAFLFYVSLLLMVYPQAMASVSAFVIIFVLSILSLRMIAKKPTVVHS